MATLRLWVADPSRWRRLIEAGGTGVSDPRRKYRALYISGDWNTLDRPHSATAPFAPKDGDQGLRLRSGLRRTGIHHRRMFHNRLSAPCWLGTLRYRLRGATGF